MEYTPDTNTIYSQLLYINPNYNGGENGEPETLPASVLGDVEISLIAISGSTVVDSTDSFLSQNFRTDTKGVFSILFKSGWLTNSLKRFIDKYINSNYQIKFKVLINIDRGDFPKNTYRDIIYFIFDGDYNIDGDSFTQPNPCSPIVIESSQNDDIYLLKSSFKTIEESYLLAKKQYETQLKSNIDISIDTVNKYEPRSFRNVITRLLEFQEGTINPSLEYTKTIGMTEEYKRLETINKLILSLTKMYPSIKIDDGEGIPYNGK